MCVRCVLRYVWWYFFFFKQKTAYEMRISDWSSDVCSSDLKLVDQDSLTKEAITAVEQNGIVFLDEIDKICARSEYRGGGDVSREGVQRDLLPLIEGTVVNTKHGTVKTEDRKSTRLNSSH